ncbi:hypothetical protein BATDEDRAFT_87885 [Batrachochytrium dendrobatidis JAM81]|uniref:Telomere-associated protein Rif1 N-terminal domain-containing protein n=2 Tax=Batrachochytrium dendrobatidis TaxID=109871 RepID=F4P0G9_BATDJ|nr:uncharacterized protein BATDEDRAFT_87885 [Batrachochytrium dendrobatidis JAM81]EGF81282.1 hypothetical protein BATDEDRAFT_87885 [Batrachochytrium dendrobatidis JAM81]OAJ38145.1 hypothetical protein BDEG_22098 [Batrachochytrium dendrobatidis JEL423]|eukprot:XP_006678152.1 hypothetical protein BATDEDRAFT_87885 [Batrachochytrium dendrobatidis JAM81]
MEMTVFLQSDSTTLSERSEIWKTVFQTLRNAQTTLDTQISHDALKEPAVADLQLTLSATGSSAKSAILSTALDFSQEKLSGLVSAWERDLAPTFISSRTELSDTLEKDALACLSAVLFQEELVKLLTESQLSSLLDILICIISSASCGDYPQSTCQLAVWTLSSQKIQPTRIIELKADRIIAALMSCLQSNHVNLVDGALRAFSRVCMQSSYFSQNVSSWFGIVMDLLFSAETSIRRSADSFLSLIAPQMITFSEIHLEPSKKSSRSSSGFISKFIDTLSAHSNDGINMMCAWGHVMIAFGVKLHKTESLNTLLSIAEPNFNSTRPAQRIAAFRAWKRLILNFSLNGHLFYSKRVKLILLPIWHCLRLEKKNSVRQAAFETYMYLLVHLGRRSMPLAGFLENYVLPTLQYILSKGTMLEILLLALADLIDKPAEPISQDATIMILDSSAIDLSGQICRYIPVEAWTQADFDVLVQCVSLSLNRLEQAQEPCYRIWTKICDFTQSLLKLEIDRGRKCMLSIVKFLGSLVQSESVSVATLAMELYLPGVTLLSFEFCNLFSEDIDMFKYILEEGVGFMSMKLAPTTLDAWLRFSKEILAMIPEGSVSENVIIALEQVETNLATHFSKVNTVQDSPAVEESIGSLDNEDSNDTVTAIEHADDSALLDLDSSIQMDFLQPKHSFTMPDNSLHKVTQEKRKSDITATDVRPVKRVLANDGREFTMHLKKLVQFQEDLNVMDANEILRVQTTLVQLMGMCCERLSQ